MIATYRRAVLTSAAAFAGALCLLAAAPLAMAADEAPDAMIQRLSDGRIQMPDVYRIAFGLGRRGGVKPLK